MALLKIALMGDPILAEKSQSVADPKSQHVTTLLEDMEETMLDAGGTGLAAPQVHCPSRVMLFAAQREGIDNDSNPNTDYESLTNLVNPKWKPLSNQMEVGWEGCLSVPGLTGAVPRHTHIEYEGYTAEGAFIKREATGFHARVFQHEFDHLDGILYLQRMTDLRLLVFTEEVARHGLPAFRTEPTSVVENNDS